MRDFLRAVTITLILAMLIAVPVFATPIGSLHALASGKNGLFADGSGGAVVMRVSDGKVIAVFNPNLSCRQLHPPGSIFKLVTAFGVLRERITTESAIYRCGGQIKIDGQVLHCTLPNGHGRLRLPQALSQSCNCIFYALGRKLGSERLLKYARIFGLDKPCPGYAAKQATGRLPKPPRNTVATVRLAIGQSDGFAITLLEAAEMVRRIVTNDVSVPNTNITTIQRNLSTIRKSMRLAVINGTCRTAALSSIEVAGKTGSPEADNDSNARSGWFVGYAPYRKPEIIVAVFVNRGHGYDKAAPAARRIFSAYFGAK